jgi:hypothetical protein
VTSLSATVFGNSSTHLLCALPVTSLNWYYVHDISVIYTQGGWKFMPKILDIILLTKNKMKMVTLATFL